jgi:hypothetical protein
MGDDMSGTRSKHGKMINASDILVETPERRRPFEERNSVRKNIQSITETVWGCEMQGAVRGSSERCSKLPGSQKVGFPSSSSNFQPLKLYCNLLMLGQLIFNKIIKLRCVLVRINLPCNTWAIK